MSETESVKRRGRPPAFNHENALDKAMHLFWMHGYDGTSMSMLTETLGINKPSIYGAFGDKEQLFRKAVDKYLTEASTLVFESIREPTSYKVAEKFLTAAAKFLTDTKHPPGCMLTQSALTSSLQSEAMKDLLSHYRESYEIALEERFTQAQANNDLPVSTDPAALAKLLATLHQGMSVQASGGASEDDLMQVVKSVLVAWPSGPTD